MTKQEAQGEALALARRLHETYEALAPQFGYETRTETRTFDPQSPNGRLMVAVCAALAQGEAPPPSVLLRWQLVPRKPTPQMIEAGSLRAGVAECYLDMLAAAPPPEQAQPAPCDGCTSAACVDNGCIAAPHNLGAAQPAVPALTADALWNNSAVMSLNAELGLTMEQLLALARALTKGPNDGRNDRAGLRAHGGLLPGGRGVHLSGGDAAGLATPPAQVEQPALTDAEIDAVIVKEMGPWMEDQDDLVLYRQVAKAVLLAAALAQGEAPPPSVSDFQLEQLFDAVHEHGEFGRGFREHARRILAAAPPPEQAQPAVPQPSPDLIRRTNEEYAAWCKTYYQPEALDERGMPSLHGLWAWQEQERRKTAAQPAVPALTDEQIKVMADRLMGWPLPKNFNPDGGITFQQIHEFHWPTGTNLLSHEQAMDMLRYANAALTRKDSHG